MLRKRAALTKNLRVGALSALLGAFLLCGCSAAPGSEPAEGAAGAANSPICRAPQGVSASPRTIEAVVTLLNALPKPTSVNCFLESLDRPLFADATNNVISAQPAFSPKSPRIFLRLDQLILSVVPEGEGSHLIEFGYLLDGNARSIKAELALPLTNTLLPSAPYEHARATDVHGAILGGTSCAGCHAAEERVPSIDFATAYSSVALRPNPTYRVSLDTLIEAQKTCDATAFPERCAMLSALLAHGSVLQANFPDTMTIFN